MEVRKRKSTLKVETDYKMNNSITFNEIVQAYNTGATLTGKPIDYSLNSKCLIIDLGGGITADMPFNEVCIEELKYINEELPEQAYQALKKDVLRFKVLKIDESKIILSRRANLVESFKKISKMNQKKVFNAVITNTENFGVFCDIGEGLTALCPVNEISRTRIDAKTWLPIGSRVKVKITKAIPEKMQFKCSIKKAYPSNYAEIKPKSKIYVRLGQKITDRTGKVSGFYVEVTPSISGIADVKPDCKQIHRDLKTGDVVRVYIRKVIPEENRVKLFLL